jgi:hypothetical protein
VPGSFHASFHPREAVAGGWRGHKCVVPANRRVGRCGSWRPMWARRLLPFPAKHGSTQFIILVSVLSLAEETGGAAYERRCLCTVKNHILSTWINYLWRFQRWSGEFPDFGRCSNLLSLSLGESSGARCKTLAVGSCRMQNAPFALVFCLSCLWC